MQAVRGRADPRRAFRLCAQGLQSLVNLKILDVANNRLESLEGLATLTKLTDLWANDNAVASLDGVEAALAPQRATLTCVYLRGNPAAAEPHYKLRLCHLLPKLEQLDDAPVGA
jgi:protein phosphatase 1 regulatory subunit 7